MQAPDIPRAEGSVEPRPRAWWEQRTTVAVLMLLAAIPLLYPQVPPLVDLFGHMGRYRVELDLGTSPWLSQYYSFHWAAIGNLGVDLLVVPLGRLLGLEPAVKLIVMAIPPLTVGGFLWVAREVHGRVPPTALFALPFAFAHPFMFGFVNYALSIALAFLGFALWLRLARLGKLKLRAILFVPISILVFFVHTFGWGVLGLLCFSAEAVRQHDRGAGLLRSAWNAALQASVMALPLLVMVAWRSETHGGMTRGWFDWSFKAQYIDRALRDRWRTFDEATLVVIGLVLAFAVASRRLGFSRNLLLTACVLLVAFLIMPRTIFGSTYADMRLIPFVIAVAVLAIRFRGDIDLPLARVLAFAGLALFLVRIGANTLSFATAADDQRAKLQALDHVPMGARVASIVGEQDCGRAWALPRNSHLGAMTIVRRQGFSNDEWAIAGQNLLDLRYHAAGVFASDPSQIVRPAFCTGRGGWPIDTALRFLPRDKFDYLWMIDAPAADPRLLAGMQAVWRGPGSILYRLHP
jgi:hypothetical protein